MEQDSIADILNVLGGNKDFKVSLDNQSIIILSIALALAIFIGQFVASAMVKKVL